MRRFLLAAATICSLAWPSSARAHEGPPFPIVVDQRVGPYLVSVWTDPDIGTGTFFVVLRGVDGTVFQPPASVRVAVAPVSGRRPELAYEATSQPVRSGARYFTEVSFDRGELWNVRVVIEGPGGGGELRSRVEATPDGTLGPIGSLVYAFPFVLLALVWWRVAVARRRGVGTVTLPEEAGQEGSGQSDARATH